MMKGLTIDLTKTGIDKVQLGEMPQSVAGPGQVLIQVKAVPLSSWKRAFI